MAASLAQLFFACKAHSITAIRRTLNYRILFEVSEIMHLNRSA
jgi:hypothetical protein